MRDFLYILIALYVIAGALLYLFQRNLLYIPSAEYQHRFEQISIKNNKLTLEIIVLNQGRENALIYFGGNAEAVVANAQSFSEKFTNKTIYLVNYRGYGGSTGKPSQIALFSDAELIFDQLSQHHENIAVIGRSLGSGVAMHLASQRSVNQLVLITPFDSILAIAQEQFPMFPIAILLKDPYDSIALADKVSANVLLVAGGVDSVIPRKHTQRLFEALGKDKAQLVLIEQAGHNDISQFSAFYESISQFFSETE